MSKIFAIGDIHGCHRQLIALIARLPLDRAKDTLVFLGDYINRGPDSRKVLDTLIGLQRSCCRAIFLKGNHEQALLEYNPDSDSGGLNLLRTMGIEATAESYGAPLRRLIDLTCMPPEHQQFLFDLRLNFSCDGFFFTHADFDPAPPATTTAETPRDRMQRQQAEAQLLVSRRLGREAALQPSPPWTVVFGHLPHATPLVKPDRIGIDTGAVYGNLLTAVQLPERIFYHA
ncbi:MAG: serine/threonine protein phosphatase [Desulfobulbus sp.]|nr:serine/threonine protein phosphatase [Desulfobulbus sp.]